MRTHSSAWWPRVRSEVAAVPVAVILGVLAGGASFLFLEALDAVTRERIDTPALILGLPLVGIAVGWGHQRLSRSERGRRAVAGTATVIEALHDPAVAVPRRTAPIVATGSLAAHLVGASVGREGVALQLAGALAEGVSRVSKRLRPPGPIMTTIAVAGGFGSVFGVPIAGCIFALEVASTRRLRQRLVLPAVTASVIGHAVVRFLGHDHASRIPMDLDLDVATVLRLIVAGCIFGLVAMAFVQAVDAIRRLAGIVVWAWLRPGLGGLATLGLVVVAGRDFLGLSLPLLDRALAGEAGSWVDPALKILFTAIAVGSGFPGGEVTPLFVIGATTGAAFAGVVGLPVAAAAGVGMVAVFASAASTPIACTIIAVELFGADALVPAAIACAIACVAGRHRGIYPVPTPGTYRATPG